MESGNKKKKIILIIALIIMLCALIVVSLFAYFISPVDKSGKEKEFIVDSGESYASIGKKLEEEGLIKNEMFYKLYIKLNSSNSLEAGKYFLSPSMSLNQIITTFEKGAVRSTKNVTFVEGKNIRNVIAVITENFNITEEEILEKISDSLYLDKLINKYWFITDEIKNEKLYYSLEGYLFPDTYEFYEDSSLEEIFEIILNNFESKLSTYKEKIEASSYTFHELLTLSSVVESEGASKTDRDKIASVFFNRLNDGMSLGSDVTTFYAEKLEFYERDLYLTELNECNDYNTRSSCMAGKLPVGPICNVSIISLEAVINPAETNYYFFVSDKDGNNYFTETSSEHNRTINRLKSEGKWLR